MGCCSSSDVKKPQGDVEVNSLTGTKVELLGGGDDEDLELVLSPAEKEDEEMKVPLEMDKEEGELGEQGGHQVPEYQAANDEDANDTSDEEPEQNVQQEVAAQVEEKKVEEDPEMNAQQEAAFERAKSLMKRMRMGVELTRFNRMGKGKKKLYWMSTSFDRVFWGSDKKHRKGYHLIRELREVVQNPPNAKDPELGLEIHWKTSKPFILQAANLEDKEVFLDGLQYAMEVYSPYSAELPHGVDFENLTKPTRLARRANGEETELHFWFPPSLDRCFWANPDLLGTGRVSGMILTLTIRDVKPDKSDARAFTIYGFENHRLDIVANSQEERDYWVECITYLRQTMPRL